MRAKHVRLEVNSDGEVTIVSPFGVELPVIEKFFIAKQQWVLEKIEAFKCVDRKVIRTFSDEDYLENREKVLTFVRERMDFYNQNLGFSFGEISIKDLKTRWGSCSNKGNISISYKILFLPEKHRDYIIAHELCHLKHFNHSKKFWALVEKLIPNYLEAKKGLRHHELLYK